LTALLKNVRRVLRWLWASLLALSGSLWWAKYQLRRRGAVVVFMLHRVLDDVSYGTTNSLPGILMRERTFRHFVAYVVGQCEPLNLSEAEPGKHRRKLGVVLTFDDGWKDNYQVAFPIARQYNVPFTVFVCPGLVDRNIPFWPERVVVLMRSSRPATEDAEIEVLIEKLKICTEERREQYLAEFSEQRQVSCLDKPSTVDKTLSWTEIAEMDRAGVSFGSHTQTHQILTTVSAEKARQEIRQSKTEIERALGRRCNAFAYPNGNWSSETQRILAEAGFEFALTTQPGAWTATGDHLTIPRSSVYEDNVVGPAGRFSPAMFEYMAFWKAWRAMKLNSGVNRHAQRQPAPVAF
jgi:peptidoglycan/xylan/chitin deacetylase (PgdA/CDA1 family)